MCQEFFEAFFETLCDLAYWVLEKVNGFLHRVAREDTESSGG